ncbi:MAG TPA: amidohydrolase family protein [Nocardioides sp.]|uniref:amidohydrolase family protein n=1 Tax=Nocardioides sp. TaxID=35761 RepID=UPI002E35CF69|nr:amidohydrolase family protein [Nocardioides sp.]HEX3930316.1 amidohydrolase family protein [Nocardioides sp.]
MADDWALSVDQALDVSLERAMDDLVDHHCHGVLTDDLDRAAFEALMNEAVRPAPLGTTLFDSTLGWAIRRHCATVLDLEPLAPAEEYLARRTELGGAEASRRLLGQARIATLLVDTGLGPDDLTSMAELAALCGGTAREVVRLERLAEQVLAAGTGDFAGEVEERLRQSRASGAVGAKSIAAYRVGLDLPATKPASDELAAAVAGVDPRRLVDRTVSGWLAHTALELGLPLQLHVGYGDSDLDLLACDPLRLTAFLRSTQEHGAPVLLLHNWPYHRQAAYLAQVFDHVFMDLGLTTHNTGALSTGILRETLELVPFGKLLFSSDAYGLAELYLLGAVLFRRAMTTVLGELVAAGEATSDDALRVARLVSQENARRAYAL